MAEMSERELLTQLSILRDEAGRLKLPKTQDGLKAAFRVLMVELEEKSEAERPIRSPEKQQHPWKST